MDNKDLDNTIGRMSMPAGFRYRSVFLKGRPQHEKYDDFQLKHPPMDTLRRAKLFAPFDALAGFSDCIADKEIVYTGRRELSDEEKETLDRKLSVLRYLTRNGREARKNCPQITVRYFCVCTDENSPACGRDGTCRTVTGVCRKADIISGTLIVDETILPFGDILSIEGDLFGSPEDDIP